MSKSIQFHPQKWIEMVVLKALLTKKDANQRLLEMCGTHLEWRICFLGYIVMGNSLGMFLAIALQELRYWYDFTNPKPQSVEFEMQYIIIQSI